ncbi:TLC domain-containing protein 5-like [Anthonomus grandis grandis]|uniref:TLC domain-containing protein 5-like n=1 Tax=Anthonomus grandis grandis TaxID=2921223 RepID=UPI002164F5A6|nr:TLC domain-containing protein 5-like [Anthonomus grandis grandis]
MDTIVSKHPSAPINYNVYDDTGHVNFESPICMFISAVIWRSIYYLSLLYFPNQSKEFSCRICSLLHGIVTAFMGINQCFLFDWPFDHPEWKTSYTQSFIMTMSWGYFFHDFIWMLQYDRADKTMMAHHLISLLGLTRFIFKGYTGAQVTCSLGSMELTNPFLQARWYLRTAGMQGTPVHISTEISFMLVFIAIRIILGTYFFVIILRQSKNDWDFIIISIGIYVVSWVFTWGIVQLVLKRYFKQNRNDVVASAQKDQ